MILTEQEVMARLGSEKNLLNKIEKLLPKKVDLNSPIPRGTGLPNSIPMKIKTTAAILTRMGQSTTTTGNQLGMSRDYALKIKSGTAYLPEENIDLKLKAIQETAIAKITSVFDKITDEKIDKSTAKDLSTIARNLMSIGTFDRIPGADRVNSVQAPQVLVYAPTVKTENNYTIVDA